MHAPAPSFFIPGFRYAVVGATTDHTKYGYRVLMDLHKAGYAVVGVNPKYRDIEGVPVFSSLGQLPHKPDVVVFVLPPAIGLTILDEVAKFGIKLVWFQPGAESEEIQTKANLLGLTAQADGSCIMVARRAFSGTM